jgi:hypothetical protein
VRPDFYVYGSVATAGELPGLLEELFATLNIDKETPAHV